MIILKKEDRVSKFCEYYRARSTMKLINCKGCNKNSMILERNHISFLFHYITTAKYTPNLSHYLPIGNSFVQPRTLHLTNGLYQSEKATKIEIQTTGGLRYHTESLIKATEIPCPCLP